MSNIKFSQLPNLSTVTDTTIVPVVAAGTNYSVTAANLKNYTSNVATVSATGNITANYFVGNGSLLTGIVSSYGDANVVSLVGSFGSNTISTTGNITAGYVLGNGSQLTGLPATYSNANVVAQMAAFGSNTISTTGNITAGLFIGNGSQLTGVVSSYGNANVATLLAGFGSNTISTTGNITSQNFIGNGSTLSSITGANVTGTVALATTATTAGTVTTAAQPNITSVGTLTSLSSTGNVQASNLRTTGVISATGNITGSFFLGNGSQLTGIAATYSNANVSAFMAAFGSNAISTTGNVTAGYVIGNGSLLTSVTATTATNATNVDITDDTVNVNTHYPTMVIATAGSNPLKTSSTKLSFVPSTGALNAAGNITGSNFTTAGLVTATGNITGSNFTTAGVVTATGNIVSAANIQGQNIISSARSQAVNYSESVYAIGTITGATTPNISLGAIQSATLIGNITLNSITNIQTGQSATFILTQDATGGRTLTSTWKFAAGSKTLSTAANSVDIISVFYDGSTYWAVLSKGFV